MCEIVLRGMQQSTFDDKSKSGNGLGLSGTKPLSEPMLTQIYAAKWRHLAARSYAWMNITDPAWMSHYILPLTIGILNRILISNRGVDNRGPRYIVNLGIRRQCNARVNKTIQWHWPIFYLLLSREFGRITHEIGFLVSNIFQWTRT